jgi:hypothetical protein
VFSKCRPNAPHQRVDQEEQTEDFLVIHGIPCDNMDNSIEKM